MKQWLKYFPILFVLGFVLYALRAAAQANPHGYTCTVTAVSSSTTPTAIATPGEITSWIFHVESGSSTAVDIFPYAGNTVPGAAPSPAAYMELTAGAYLPDAITCDSAACRQAMGQGWAAVLPTGSTSVNVDVCTR